MVKKQGQVSLFAVIGLVVLSIIVVLVASLGDDDIIVNIERPYDIHADHSLMDCIDKNTAKAILDVARSGGYYIENDAWSIYLDNNLGRIEGLLFEQYFVPYGLLRPGIEDEGIIIDSNYMEPPYDIIKNRYGKIKLIPLKGEISMMSNMERSVMDNLEAECVILDDNGDPIILFMDVELDYATHNIISTITVRHIPSGTIRVVEHSYKASIAQLHSELYSFLEVMAYDYNTHYSTFFTDDYEVTYDNRVLTLTETNSDVYGEKLIFNIGIQDRYPMLRSLRCIGGNPDVFDPDIDDNPLNSIISHTCDGDYLMDIVIGAEYGPPRHIRGVITI